MRMISSIFHIGFLFARPSNHTDSQHFRQGNEKANGSKAGLPRPHTLESVALQAATFAWILM